MSLYELSAGPDAPRKIHVVIEIPSGCRNKYEYDPESGLFRLDRVLYSAVHYPTGYGFIPHTLAADGDPLDVMVVTTEPTFTGCLLEARPVGVLRMRDEKGDDEKVLAVPVGDPNHIHVREFADVPSHLLREIEHFFEIYKDLEGKPVQTFGWEDRPAAEKVILSSMENFPE